MKIGAAVFDLETYRNTKNRGLALAIPFGQAAANTRKGQGVSQQVLGRKVGRDQSTVSRVEGGIVSVEPDLAVDLARALNKPELLLLYCEECPVAKAYRRMTSGEPKPAA